MNSHDLAKLLLALPDKPVKVVVPGCLGTRAIRELEISRGPWEGYVGEIRLEADTAEFIAKQKKEKNENNQS